MKKAVKVALILAGALVVGFGVFMLVMAPKFVEHRRVRDMAISEPELALVPDGDYPGSFTCGGFTYAVLVRVRGARLEEIRVLVNRSDDGYALRAEKVLDRVLEEQSLQVDTVSGASTTSKALLKAVENALVRAEGGLEGDG